VTLAETPGESTERAAKLDLDAIGATDSAVTMPDSQGGAKRTAPTTRAMPASLGARAVRIHASAGNRRLACVAVILAVAAANGIVHVAASLGTQLTHGFSIGLAAVLPGVVGAVFLGVAAVAGAGSTCLGARRTSCTRAARCLAASASAASDAASPAHARHAGTVQDSYPIVVRTHQSGALHAD